MAGTEYEKAAIGGPVTRCEPGPCGRDKQMIEVRAAPEASFAVNVAVIETNARTEGPGDPSHAPRWRVSQREAAFERRKQLAGSRDETKRAKTPFDTQAWIFLTSAAIPEFAPLGVPGPEWMFHAA